MTSNTVLQITNMYAGYDGREILHDVSLSVSKGAIVSLIGPNGAGKTTVLKAIAGLIQTRKGTICVDGFNITNFEINKRIISGVVHFLQGGRVFKNSTCEENLLVAGDYLKQEDRDRKIEDIYDFFPLLRTKRKERAGLFSGGEKQMLALGIVLMKKPSILLLDEPSAGLSPIYLREFFEKIVTLNKKSGLSILLVEQNIKEALKISDKAYLMRQGRIIGEETVPKTLLNNSKIQHLFFNEEKGQ